MIQTPTAAIIVIGNEILSGKVPDTNAEFLTRQLRELGVKLQGVFVIPDDWKVIALLVKRVATLFDHIFTSGGIGPTHDDATMRGIASGLSTCLKRHPQFETLLRKFHGEKTNECILKMAEMPEEAELIFPEGASVPAVKVRNFFILPGDPTLFKQQFLGIRERFRTASFRTQRIFLTVREDEVAAILEQAQNLFPKVQVGSYPDYQRKDWQVEVVIDSKEDELNQKAVDYILERIPKRFVCYTSLRKGE